MENYSNVFNLMGIYCVYLKFQFTNFIPNYSSILGYSPNPAKPLMPTTTIPVEDYSHPDNLFQMASFELEGWTK